MRIFRKADQPEFTDAQADEVRATVSDDPITLGAGEMPCPTCGIAAPPPPTSAAVERISFTTQVGAMGEARQFGNVSMVRCPACVGIAAEAAAVVGAHPALVTALGAARALDAAECVLVALTLLGRDTGPLLASTDAVLGSYVRTLAIPGHSVRWRLRGRPDVVNPYPWAHVRTTDRARLRGAYAGTLRDRVAAMAPPELLTPPAPVQPSGFVQWQPVTAGCLMCGVAAVEMSAGKVARLGGIEQARAEVWRPTTASVDSLGGQRSPVRFVGHLCPLCTDAFEWCGAMGASAMERSIVAHIAATGRHDPERGFGGVVGYGALVADAHRRSLRIPTSGKEPWSHLDLAPLRRALGVG